MRLAARSLALLLLGVASAAAPSRRILLVVSAIREDRVHLTQRLSRWFWAVAYDAPSPLLGAAACDALGATCLRPRLGLDAASGGERLLHPTRFASALLRYLHALGARPDALARAFPGMQTFHPLASVTVAGCHFTRSKWGCETLAYPSNLRSKDTQP